MEYRKLGRTGMTVSAVSLGCEHLQGKDYETVKTVIDAALDAGINFFDVFMSEPNVRSNIGKALKGRREKVIIQGHIGSCWVDGQYKVSRDINECVAAFEDLLDRLQTDYIDVGFLHFVDKENDWDTLEKSEVMQYALSLKEKGVIKAIGLSSHDPVTAKKAVDSGYIDVLMFSLNPAYDLVPKDRDMTEIFTEVIKGEKQDFSALTLEPARAALYRDCEDRGVAITVMKTLAMGTLLDAKRSPLGIALTEGQCISYALSRPAVAAVMVGMQRLSDVENAVKYWELSERERDHSEALASLGMFSSDGRCMYCNHCLPCPAKIDIAAVNKYLDLVELDKKPADSVSQHYTALGNTAETCLACGACETRCPFHVPVIKRMQRAAETFGK
ncbi:MAG: aldo/keto reductase [Oscillospiraceae bacterium]|nr:aldo/keto reductase [Oscillospiraceae bacterium]